MVAGARPIQLASPLAPPSRAPWLGEGWLAMASGLLVTLPVFLHAPWVRLAPFSALLFTVPLLAIGLGLGHHSDQRLRHA